MELVEFLRLDSSSSKAVMCPAGPNIGSEIAGRALRLRAIPFKTVMNASKISVEKIKPFHNRRLLRA